RRARDRTHARFGGEPLPRAAGLRGCERRLPGDARRAHGRRVGGARVDRGHAAGPASRAVARAPRHGRPLMRTRGFSSVIRIRAGADAVLVTVLGAVGGVACDSSSKGDAPSNASTGDDQPFTLVALGDQATSLLQSESSIRESWAQRFFLRAVPRSTTF